MASFTFEGDIDDAQLWYPYAITQQSQMNRLGIKRRLVRPQADVLIVITTMPNHVHIVVGLGGYEFSIHQYNNTAPVNNRHVYALDMKLQGEFDDETGIFTPKQNASPFQRDDEPVASVQENHINIWLGRGFQATGCAGRRYAAGRGVSGSILAELTERPPRVVKNRKVIFEGDVPVTAAAHNGTYTVGISCEGDLYFWSLDGERTDVGRIAPDIEVYWVFNKAGTECCGLSYQEVDPDPSVAREVTLHRVVIDYDNLTFVHLTSHVANDSFAADYDYTDEENSLVLCELQTRSRNLDTAFPPFEGDEEDSPWYGKVLRALDVDIVFSVAGNEIERYPLCYNYNIAPTVSDLVDPTDVTFEGSLLAIDVRFRAYGVRHRGRVSSPLYNTSPIAITGESQTWRLNGRYIAIPGSTAQSNIPLTPIKNRNGVYNPLLVRLMQVPAVSPKLNAMALYMRRNLISAQAQDLDFIYKDGKTELGVHKKLETELSSGEFSATLISTYSSWV